MASGDAADVISITEANRLGCPRSSARQRPVAAVVSMKRLEELEQLQDDLLDISLAAARLMTAGPERYSLDDVLAHFGYTREQIPELPE